MSKKPYDFLATDKQVMLFRAKSKIHMRDGFLEALNGERGTEIIAPSSHLVLLLGYGTSITQDAAIFAAQHDMQIAFVRGGCNIHSFWMSGRFQDPQFILNQAGLINTNKLTIAKWLLEYRLRRHGYSQDLIDEMNATKDIVFLTAWEGRWAKQVYKEYALRRKQLFTRNFDSTDEANIKLNILNNALYSICTALCLSCGVHPSLGFIHGATRRGGLAFDLADIKKNDSTLPIAFDKKISSDKQCMYKLAEVLRSNNEERIKTLVRLILMIGSGSLEQLKDFCVGSSHQQLT